MTLTFSRGDFKQLFLVILDATNLKHAIDYWTYSGAGISSRHTNLLITAIRLGEVWPPTADDQKNFIRSTLACHASSSEFKPIDVEDVFLYPNAYTALGLVKKALGALDPKYQVLANI